MRFSYDFSSIGISTINIRYLGNFILRGISRNNNLVYYLATNTTCGQTKIIEAGPYIIDINEPYKKFKLAYNTLSFKKMTIENRIEQFLRKNDLTKVELIDSETLGDEAFDVIEHFLLDADLINKSYEYMLDHPDAEEDDSEDDYDDEEEDEGYY